VCAFHGDRGGVRGFTAGDRRTTKNPQENLRAYRAKMNDVLETAGSSHTGAGAGGLFPFAFAGFFVVFAGTEFTHGALFVQLLLEPAHCAVHGFTFF